MTRDDRDVDASTPAKAPTTTAADENRLSAASRARAEAQLVDLVAVADGLEGEEEELLLRRSQPFHHSMH